MPNSKNLMHFALCILPFWGIAQNQGKSLRFTTNPLQYYFTGYNITAEKVNDDFSYGLDISFKPATCDGCEVHGGVGLLGEYPFQNMWNYNYNAFASAIHTKLFFRKNRYFSPQLYVRYWWFEDKNVSYDNVEGYRFNGIRTENQTIYGLKLSYGRIRLFDLNTKFRFILDMAVGAGYGIGRANFETRNGTVWDHHHDYLAEKITVMRPTAHVRIQIGIDIKQ